MYEFMVIPTLPPDVNIIDSLIATLIASSHIAIYVVVYRKKPMYNNISLVNILAQNHIMKCRQYCIKTDYIKQSYIICKNYWYISMLVWYTPRLGPQFFKQCIWSFHNTTHYQGVIKDTTITMKNVANVTYSAAPKRGFCPREILKIGKRSFRGRICDAPPHLRCAWYVVVVLTTKTSLLVCLLLAPLRRLLVIKELGVITRSAHADGEDDTC